MTQTTQFTIGAPARCSDGACGKVSRVVIDPVDRTLTHLAIQPSHHDGFGRLVPVDLVQQIAGEVDVHCTRAEFEKLDPAEESHFLTGSGDYGDYRGYGDDQSLSWPYYTALGGMGATGGYGFAAGGRGLGAPGAGVGIGDIGEQVTVDTVPVGEVGVRRGDHVSATDGHIGHVQGLIITPADHRVSHILLQEGHLWGRKEVAIPINAVNGVSDGITLTLSKKDVQDLPDVTLDPST